MKIFKLLSIVVFAAVLFIGCNSLNEKTNTITPIWREVVVHELAQASACAIV